MSTQPPSPLTDQVGGSHYKDLAIQPVEYITKNRLGYIEGSVIKYVTRHRAKNGAEDIKKAIHFLRLLLELQYTEAETKPGTSVDLGGKCMACGKSMPEYERSSHCICAACSTIRCSKCQRPWPFGMTCPSCSPL